MMNSKSLPILLGVIALLLAGNLIALLAAPRHAAAPAGPSFLLPAAQAQNVASSGAGAFVLDTDSFFITSDSTGQSVFLWWFEREPRRQESTLTFIGKAAAR